MNVNSALSMSRISYGMFKLSATNSAFSNVSNLSAMDALYSSRNTAKSLNLLYKNLYSNSDSASSDAANDALSSAFSKYTDKANGFYSKFTPAMTNLKDSSAAVKESLSSDSTDSVDTMLKKIKSFASDYTTASKTLQSNKNVSTAVSSMANSFSSMKFMNASMSSIGISMDKSGGMTVDEEKLTEALTNNLDQVKSILGGKNGVAAMANAKATSALSNSTNLISYTDFTSTLSRTTGLSGSANRYYAGLLMDLYA